MPLRIIQLSGTKSFHSFVTLAICFIIIPGSIAFDISFPAIWYQHASGVTEDGKIFVSIAAINVTTGWNASHLFEVTPIRQETSYDLQVLTAKEERLKLIYMMVSYRVRRQSLQPSPQYYSVLAFNYSSGYLDQITMPNSTHKMCNQTISQLYNDLPLCLLVDSQGGLYAVYNETKDFILPIVDASRPDCNYGDPVRVRFDEGPKVNNGLTVASCAACYKGDTRYGVFMTSGGEFVSLDLRNRSTISANQQKTTPRPTLGGDIWLLGTPTCSFYIASESTIYNTEIEDSNANVSSNLKAFTTFTIRTSDFLNSAVDSHSNVGDPNLKSPVFLYSIDVFMNLYASTVDGQGESLPFKDVRLPKFCPAALCDHYGIPLYDENMRFPVIYPNYVPSSPTPATDEQCWGCYLLIPLLVIPVVYVVAFTLTNKIKNKEEKSLKMLLPHREFWSNAPSYFVDGCHYIVQVIGDLLSKCKPSESSTEESKLPPSQTNTPRGGTPRSSAYQDTFTEDDSFSKKHTEYGAA